MEFRLLGPLEVETGGRVVPIRGAKQRALLALLLFRANRLVSRDLLIDRLWGEQPPATARHTLEAYVSRLRRALGAAGAAGLIESRPGGYCILVERDQLDVSRFERLVVDGEQALATGDAAGGEKLLTRALACWRGDPLADIAFESVALAESRRLEELRLNAIEQRAEARHALGRDAELVRELEPLVAAHPLRERLRAQLMRALYRCGRQVDALAVYQEGRRLLVDELGIEPGQELQALQGAILRHDPGLKPPPVEAPALAPRAPAAAAEGAVLPERRKVVTVVSCNLSGSAALAERLDPEALTALLARYVERMRAIVERHGGTLDKPAGDAVLAVFGVPLLHEDDALRACRAAVEMREALPGLGLSGRIGINSGEVIAASADRLVTGGAVAIAVRLQRAARVGEILLGQETLRLVAPVVEVESAEPLPLKSASGSVPVHRLLAVSGERPQPRETPLVGRTAELRRLGDVFAQALHDRSCQLVTLLGPAGIGKSRLAAEFLAQVEARVVQGRCLSYGEGITYWPVIEILQQLAIRPVEDAAAAAIASLCGESEQPTSSQEIAWAFRKTLEAAAMEGPLVCVFDDLHWAEPTLLDLIEHVADLSRDAPILLLCLARPELLDQRPAWAGGKLNATTSLLEPLSTDETQQLLDHLLDDQPIAEGLRRRIVEVAEGNPLFAEEMLALARQGRNGELVTPPSIQALLATRLDQLDPDERAVLERAAVEGKHFHRTAIEALAPQEPHLATHLHALVRRELIRPIRSEPGGEQAFRFRHQLIRDAAYDSLPKGVRADLHHRFARWLEEHGAGLVELDEILGYHLEQAVRYRRELGTRLEPELAARALRRLGAAGRRARARADEGAAVKLLERATALVSEREIELGLELDLLDALWWTGRVEEAHGRAASLAERAAALGDRRVELCALLQAGRYRLQLGPEGAAEELESLVEQALPVFEAAGDDLALYVAYQALGQLANWRVQEDAALAAFERAADHAQRTGLPYELLGARAEFRLYGTTPVPELLAWLEAQEERAPREPRLRRARARALARAGRFEEARALLAQVCAELEERGARFVLASTLGQGVVDVELVADDPEAAVEAGEQASRLYEQLGERASFSTAAGMLARACVAAGRLEQADAWAARAAELGASDDLATQMLWRQARALLLARGGESEAAEALAAEAVATANKSDFIDMEGVAYSDLAEVLALAGKTEQAARALEQALSRYERKQNLVMAGRTRKRLQTIREQAPA